MFRLEFLSVADRPRISQRRMTDDYSTVDIWVGHFPSQSDFDAYLVESSKDDDEPISRFAADQGTNFYDHDFVEASFRSTPVDFPQLIAGHAAEKSYFAAASAAYQSLSAGPTNAVILAFGRQFEGPQSASGDGYRLTYLGEFACEIEPPMPLGDAGPPAAVYLLFADGQPVPFVAIDARGLLIGRFASETGTPRLDLSPQVPDIAADQLKIYQDQFDQWIAEDLGDNGLSRIDGQPLVGAAFPWHGKRLAIGDVEFVWSTRPPKTR